MKSVGVLSAPTARPAPTSSRGAGAIASAPAARLTEIRPLRGLPRQKVVDALAIVVSWRDGSSPYSCQIVGEAGEILWEGPPTPASWCTFTSEPVPAAARILIRDTARRTAGWNITRIYWREVPRPDWISATADQTLASPEMAAWGIWLWRSAEAEWRLQSLAMLNASSKELVASQLIESVIAEVPLYPAK